MSSTQTPQFVKAPKGQTLAVCPLHISLHFNQERLSSVRLKRADQFSLSFEGAEKKSPIVQWFIEYLHGTILPFPYPLHLEGVGPFQREVLEHLKTIPFGKTKTYGEIAKDLGRPKAARAVGSACHINPYPLIIPCHRVLRAGGDLGGFAYGLEMKQEMLTFEQLEYIG